MNTLKGKIGLIVLVSSILFVCFRFDLVSNFFTEGIHNVFLSEEQSSVVAKPVRIMIPSIKVLADVEHVGLSAEGAVGTPKGADNTAWFNLSPSPGEPGSSIIDGHFGYKNGQPAVFDNLHKLVQGDKIYVLDSSGVMKTFIVRKVKSYGKNENVPSVFDAKDGGSHLNLITCGGDWSPAAKSHLMRLVVFADLVG